MHKLESDWLSVQFTLPLDIVKRSLLDRPYDFPADFHPDKSEIFCGDNLNIYTDGDCFDLGGRVISVIHTPVHSPGHCCFYEKERGTLYSGDLIYTDCLDAFYPTTAPVEFYNSIRKVQQLPIKRICPGHHRPNISPSIVNSIAAGFESIVKADKLYQGS